jgi:hypothetical protein
VTDSPQFLVEWSSPWREFFSAIGPALRRSPPRAYSEARAGLFPIRGLLIAWALEAAALAVSIVHPSDRLQAVMMQTTTPSHDVIYFSPEELPRTQDLAGAAAGTAGRKGGISMRGRKQVIRVARDKFLREQVIDAPQLDLPKADSIPANLLAYRAEAAPAPAESLPLKRKTAALAAAVVPPPPELKATERRATQLAAAMVAPPPVALPRQRISTKRDILAASVALPPVSAPERSTNTPARLTLPPQMVVAPAAEVNALRSLKRQGEFASPAVAAPPIELSAIRGSTRGLAADRIQAVAPPPAEIQATQGRSVRGLGDASVAPPLVDVGSLHQARTLNAANVGVNPPPVSASASPSSGKSASGANAASTAGGVVVSPNPGEKPQATPEAAKATVAFVPGGSKAMGGGGEGVGAGLSRGAASGSTPSGASTGAATIANAAGSGSANIDHAGSSPAPGPGGAGNLSNGAVRVPGVSVSGGSNAVTLPSFGAPPPRNQNSIGHSTVGKGSNAITVVASPRAGGAMNFYGELKGDRVYTIYINTTGGMTVMQFADPTSTTHTYTEELIAPVPMYTDLPASLQLGKQYVSCVLDRNGNIKNARILHAASDSQSAILTALSDWKFRPAFRGSEPVEVNVILGFGVDTN